LTRIAVLGCGFHGRGIAYQLARSGRAIDVRVLDRERERAAAVGVKIRAPWGTIDIADRDGLHEVLDSADLVVNAIGPYHQTALGVIEEAIDRGVHYVDMNDDHEVAETLLHDPSWDERARGAGVTVLIGCGVVPGLPGCSFATPPNNSIRPTASRSGSPGTTAAITQRRSNTS
jgi:lysine 6-dehydrogenase